MSRNKFNVIPRKRLPRRWWFRICVDGKSIWLASLVWWMFPPQMLTPHLLVSRSVEWRWTYLLTSKLTYDITTLLFSHSIHTYYLIYYTTSITHNFLFNYTHTHTAHGNSGAQAWDPSSSRSCAWTFRVYLLFHGSFDILYAYIRIYYVGSVSTWIATASGPASHPITHPFPPSFTPIWYNTPIHLFKSIHSSFYSFTSYACVRLIQNLRAAALLISTRRLRVLAYVATLMDMSLPSDLTTYLTTKDDNDLAQTGEVSLEES